MLDVQRHTGWRCGADGLPDAGMFPAHVVQLYFNVYKESQ